jgi:hypothetical protein
LIATINEEKRKHISEEDPNVSGNNSVSNLERQKAISIQKVFRGYMVRKMIKENKLGADNKFEVEKKLEVEDNAESSRLVANQTPEDEVHILDNIGMQNERLVAAMTNGQSGGNTEEQVEIPVEEKFLESTEELISELDTSELRTEDYYSNDEDSANFPEDSTEISEYVDIEATENLKIEKDCDASEKSARRSWMTHSVNISKYYKEISRKLPKPKKIPKEEKAGDKKVMKALKAQLLKTPRKIKAKITEQK